MLDMGRGRLAKFVGEVRVEGVPQLEGVGVMHAAAASGSLAMCTYLVETLQLDVNDVSNKGPVHLSPVAEPHGDPCGLWTNSKIWPKCLLPCSDPT